MLKKSGFFDFIGVFDSNQRVVLISSSNICHKGTYGDP